MFFRFSWLSVLSETKNFFVYSTSRGRQGRCMAVANEAPCSWLGYHGWSPWRTCQFSIILSLTWRPAKPRTGVSNFMFAATISFYFGSNRNHRSIFSTGTIARQFSQKIPVRLPQSAFYFLQFSSTISQNWESHWLSQVAELFICILERWYLILTGDMNICRMSIEHQLLTLFFHWTLDGLGFGFGVVVTTDAFHNKIRKVVSVQVCDSCRVDKMTWAPWGNPLGKNWAFNRLWIYTFIVSNSSK